MNSDSDTTWRASSEAKNVRPNRWKSRMWRYGTAGPWKNWNWTPIR